MPLFNGKYTTLKVFKIPYTNSTDICLLAENINGTQNMSISPLKLTIGTGQTGIRDIDDIETTYTFNGPCLLRSNGFLYDNLYESIDVPSLILDILSSPRKFSYLFNSTYDMNSYPALKPSLYYNDEKPTLKSAKLSLGQDGLTGNLSIVGLHSGIYEDSQPLTTPMRKTKWQDFYITAIIDGGQSIATYKLQADISLDINYIDMPYIGRAQYKRYIYNGSTLKWTIKAIYDENLAAPPVTRQDGHYDINATELSNQTPSYMQPNNNNSPGITNPYTYGSSIQFFASTSITNGDFQDKFQSVFNNLYLTDNIMAFTGTPNQTLHVIGNAWNDNAWNLISSSSTDIKFPLSEFTISGEKVFN